jgi:uncharacterized protein Veg
LGDFVRILKKEGGGKRKRSRTGCWRENWSANFVFWFF